MVVKPGSVVSLSLHHLSDNVFLRGLTATSPQQPASACPSWHLHTAVLQPLVSPTSGWENFQGDWGTGDLDLVH